MSPSHTYADTGPTSPSADLLPPGARRGSYWGTNVVVTGMTQPGKIFKAKAGTEPRSAALEADALLLGQRDGDDVDNDDDSVSV